MQMTRSGVRAAGWILAAVTLNACNGSCGGGGGAATVDPCRGSTPCFLTKKGFDFDGAQYYATIDPQGQRATLAGFRMVNGFPAVSVFPPIPSTGALELRTVYFNGGDLEIGRDMHCMWSTNPTGKGACYVSNYGPPPFDSGAANPAYPNEQAAVTEVVGVATQQASVLPFATVAMEWTPSLDTATALVPATTTGVTVRQGTTTPLTLRRGDRVTITASGSIFNGVIFGGAIGPEGTTQNFTDPGLPIPGQCSFALIAKTDGGFFCAGAVTSFVHGGGPSSLTLSINDNVPGDNSGSFTATVAVQRANNVTFYVYDRNGNRQTTAALDAEGEKPVPQMCMACHGGSYSVGTHSVQAASFLPFDLGSFRYGTAQGFTRAQQEEQFRELNRFVRFTRPNPDNPRDPIGQWINGMYSNNVTQMGQTSRDDWVPPGWTAQAGAYRNFVAPYCRTCHVAVASEALDFTRHVDFRTFPLIRPDVCGQRTMAHAQVPFRKLWRTPLQALVLDDPSVIDPPPGDDPTLPADDPNTVGDNGRGYRLCRDE